ncbi:hypothetical protein AUEXF2481DRAFT_43001 [Aureobasidium subglaciale EXF-2481]|uniref:REJ domain-containing protein n=1 Tax=Aureobasidium subglaciale (strain EXF-2481) TaxID=1043005 RepID=A0A074YEN3_AURSE|nr:uncharacterized protein AUEXF2481DRAFT_43001 [Aureobasidium subglaciale EXF-2481]KEQ92562.1 hypothetical protein AUEXF2481DRAFT_43001 [Aureobasidium subglaciale EXF-2481]
MRSFIALLSFAASTQSVAHAYSQCTDSSVHHTTTILIRDFTSTLTSIPTLSNVASGKGNQISSSSFGTHGLASSGDNIATRSSSGSAATGVIIGSPSSIVATSGRPPQLSLSTSVLQPNSPISFGASGQSQIRSSFPFPSSSISPTAPSASTLSTQSRYNSPPTMATSTASITTEATLPKHSVVAFTGSSSTIRPTDGAIITGLLFVMLFL